MYTNKQKTHFPWTSCFGILYDFLPLRSNTLATLLGLLFWPLVCLLLFCLLFETGPLGDLGLVTWLGWMASEKMLPHSF